MTSVSPSRLFDSESGGKVGAGTTTVELVVMLLAKTEIEAAIPVLLSCGMWLGLRLGMVRGWRRRWRRLGRR